MLELVVVMAILATVAAIAVWGVISILPDLRLKAAVRNLKSDLHLARLTAVRQNAFIVSEFNTNHNFYTIYIDDGDGNSTKAHNYCRDAGEATIKSVRIHPHVHMLGAKFGANDGKFAFNSRGAIDGLAGGVYLCNDIKTYRGVAVSRIGKITIKVSTDGSEWYRLD